MKRTLRRITNHFYMEAFFLSFFLSVCQSVLFLGGGKKQTGGKDYKGKKLLTKTKIKVPICSFHSFS